MGYLRVTKPQKKFSNQIAKNIVGDSTGTIHWPIIQLKTVCNRLPGTPLQIDIKRLCEKHGIKVVFDPMLGYIMNPIGVHRLLSVIQMKNHPGTTDRISLLLWLLGLDTPDVRKYPPFHKHLEEEIERIAKLEEPYRTEIALRLALRYRDAEQIAEVITKAKIKDVETLERKNRAAALKGKITKLARLELLDQNDAMTAKMIKTLSQSIAHHH